MSDKEKVPRQRGRVEALGGGRFKVTVYVGTLADGKRQYHRKTLHETTEAKAWKHARRRGSPCGERNCFATDSHPRRASGRCKVLMYYA
ncbi:MAG: hypothetical protein DMF67_09775 [Acidobacteria bacterium]|nr:MAG: hypothetical protein DMF67_09775 [Acidobacteriota bacterium]